MKKWMLQRLQLKKIDFKQPDSWPIGDYQLLFNERVTILTIPQEQICADYLNGYIKRLSIRDSNK